MSLKEGYLDFDGYIRQGEPAKGFDSLLYPDKPHHPRQKYLLTVKGTLLYNQLKKTQ